MTDCEMGMYVFLWHLAGWGREGVAGEGVCFLLYADFNVNFPCTQYRKIAKKVTLLKMMNQTDITNDNYSRTSVTRTLMARLLRLFQTRS